MFITFEGPDGSGKTTAIEKLVQWLDSINKEYILTKEPGSSHMPVNKEIRKILVSNDLKMSGMTEAILFSADRRGHLESVIWPALKENKIVLCDRYFDSTFAYQGHARGLGIEKMIELQESITDHTYPDITFYFDLPLDVALKRVEKRGEKNRLDGETIDFYQKVHEGYKNIIQRHTSRFRIIDASKSEDDVFNQLKSIFEKEVLNK